jgi:hypothetical protein
VSFFDSFVGRIIMFLYFRIAAKLEYVVVVGG